MLKEDVVDQRAVFVNTIDAVLAVPVLTRENSQVNGRALPLCHRRLTLP
jgi:hypothetical protein